MPSDGHSATFLPSDHDAVEGLHSAQSFNSIIDWRLLLHSCRNHILLLTFQFQFHSDHVILLSRGRIVALGHPRHVLTDALLSDVFDCEVKVSVPPQPDVPYVLPQLCRLNRKTVHGINAKT